jgi:hypothetical protein
VVATLLTSGGINRDASIELRHACEFKRAAIAGVVESKGVQKG